MKNLGCNKYSASPLRLDWSIDINTLLNVLLNSLLFGSAPGSFLRIPFFECSRSGIGERRVTTREKRGAKGGGGGVKEEEEHQV